MKLRNKKTGEIVEFRYLQTDYVAPLVMTIKSKDELKMEEFASLHELYSEWEDVPEESKEYWYVSCDGRALKATTDEDDYNEKHISGHKSIGNYFETKEEAEKAVERLRAWKRLKDKGFRFTGYDTNYGHHRASFVFEKEAWATETEPDLDLLFGGEE